MAKSLNIQPTAFPRFDALSASIRHEHHGELEYHRRDFNFATQNATHPKGRDALLESYSQFIAAITGESGILYQYALRTSLHTPPGLQIVHAEILDEETIPESETDSDCVLHIIQQEEEDTKNFDFGLELLADVENFNSAEAPALLGCPFVIQYHAMEMTLAMRYNSYLMDEDYADAAFKMLVNHISRTKIYATQEIQLSVLNYLPLQRPPPLKHLQGGDALMPLLHSGFQRAVKEHPGRHALDYRSETTQFTMTYGQLDAITTSLAHNLRSSVPHTSRSAQRIVPAYIGASPAFYISWLAVLKAGFAFCPLPVGAPPIELQSIVQDICAAVVLTNGPMLCGCPWDAWYCSVDELSTCLDVNDFIINWMQAPHGPESQPLPSVAETDLAYVMYSSSSTGMPKGMKISHLAASCSIASHCKQIPTYMSKRGFRWLQSSSLTSFISTLEIFTTWWTGGTLCSVPLLSLTSLTTAIDKVSATITTANHTMASTLNPSQTPSLRQLWCTGPCFSSSLLENLEQKTPHTAYSPLTLPKLYTSTTNTIPATILPSASSSIRDSVIGYPLQTTGLLLLCSRTRTPIPLGAVGDLYISSPCLPSGFLHRPDLDAETFFSHSAYGRLLKTGDRARLVKDADGEFMVDVLRRSGSEGVRGKEVVEEEESVDGRDSVASMVDSCTGVGVLEDKEIDVAEANVLSLIGRMYT